MRKSDMIFRETSVTVSSTANMISSDHFKVAEYLGGLGDENERVIPISIKGNISLQNAADVIMQGRIYAVTHISTSSEQWVEIADNTNRLVYSEFQNMFGDEFNFRQIGKIFPSMNRSNAMGSYNYKFNKELRKLLDRKITDPDFDPEFVIVVVIFCNGSMSSGNKVTIQSINELEYDIGNRTLSNLPA